jgi:mRNA interferase MazF
VDEPYVPERGDLAWLTLDPQAGHEQAGRRPVLILSPLAFNERTTLAFCCPVTSRVRGHVFEVPLPDGLRVTGVVLTEQLKSLSWTQRRAEFITRAPEAVLRSVSARLAAILALGDDR